MKTINEYKLNNSFCIDAGVIEDLAAIKKHYGHDLIAVAKAKESTNDLMLYAVRWANTNEGMFDCLVEVKVGGAIHTHFQKTMFVWGRKAA